MSKGYLYDEGDELITRKENGLPDTSTASAGDVLSLNSAKKPYWSSIAGAVSVIRFYTISSEAQTVTIGDNNYNFYPLEDEGGPVKYQDFASNFTSAPYSMPMLRIPTNMPNVKSAADFAIVGSYGYDNSITTIGSTYPYYVLFTLLNPSGDDTSVMISATGISAYLGLLEAQV